MSAAKWHRERAAEFTKRADECPDQGYDGWVFGYRDNAAHHATAATALDALAVPGVADVLLAVAAMHETPGTQEHRDALATLARIARGE